MDLAAYFAITHRTHGFCNPLSVDLLERVLAFAGLVSGERAADLGAGNAAMSLHLAERYGLLVDAVEQAPPMVALAEARLAGHPAASAVTLHANSASAFLQDAKAFDLLVVMGAYGVAPGAEGPAEVFSALKARLAPGGRLLFGDPFFRADASAALRASLPHVRTFAEYVRAGTAAGLRPVYATESTRQDWDEYAWRMWASLDAHQKEYPGDPSLPVVSDRLAQMRDQYLDGARDSLGFGVFLFRNEEQG